MTKQRFFSILLVFVALVVTTTAGVIPDMKFRRLDTRDGLSNSQALCIYRDSHGFVWMGTAYGLNRYDGYRFKTFFSYVKDTTTMRGNYVDEIYEAFDGKLWLKQGMNYTVFDPVTERFDQHPEYWLHEQGVEGGIERLFLAANKDLWVKTFDTGFWHLNPVTKKVKHYSFGYGPQEFNNDFGLSGFAEFDGKTYISSYNGEIFCFDPNKDQILWKDNYLRSKGLVNGQDCKLRMDAAGRLWVITMGHVHVRTGGKDGHWYHSAEEALHSWGFSDVPEMAAWDMNVDTKGRTWVATDHGGLFVFDMKAHEYRQFLNDKFDENSISDNTLRNIYRDKDGRMWIGSYMNGVNLYTENLSNFMNVDLGNINTVCADRAGFYWLGTNDAGILRYDPKTQEKVVYDKANSGLGSNIMVSSLAARDGSVWFGTYEGGLIHIKDGHVSNLRATGDSTGLASNNIWTIYEDNNGYIWIGTLGGGVQRLDPKTGRMRTINMKNSPIPSDYISTITPTKKGWLMVAHSYYYSIIDPLRFKVYNRNITNNRDGIGITETSICGMEDSRGLVWQGSTSGATVWDPAGDHVYLLDMKSGLMGSTVNGFVKDNRHTIWLETDHGLSNIIPQKQEDGTWTFVVRSFNNRDGLQNATYNQRSICYTPDGLVLVGGQGGLDIINPQQLGAGRVKETPLFSGLKVFDREVEPSREFDGRVILSEALDCCRELNLRYNENNFTIQLSSSSGEIHNRSRFAYKLLGFNEEWVRTEEVNPNITYMSLPSGSYTLCVRMLNDDGTIGDIESRLDIRISPPFYRSWWAYLLYLALIGAALWWLRKHFIYRKNKQQVFDDFRRETEKEQWMNEMRRQFAMQNEQETTDNGPQNFVKPVTREDIQLEKTTKNIVDFVRNLTEHFVPQRTTDNGQRTKRVNVSFNATTEFVLASFDPAQLGEALNLLMNNSVRFCPIDCNLQVSLFAPSEETVKILVADNGVGIVDEYKEHIFEHVMVEGEELGLDRVKAIVEAHDGGITVENNPGGGTVFVISLPTGELIYEAELMD